MSKPNTYTAQYLGKWHAGFNIGNQSFVLQAHEGTEEEANWYAEMMDKAFAKLRVVEEVELVRDGSVDDGQGGTIPLYVHKNCPGPYHEICGYEDSDEVDATYCPGCGGKIKR